MVLAPMLLCHLPPPPPPTTTGIKNIHVVPYISQFCLLAHDIEVLLAAVGPPVAGSTTPSTQEGEDPTAGGGSSSGGDPVVRQALSSVREGGVGAGHHYLLTFGSPRGAHPAVAMLCSSPDPHLVSTHTQAGRLSCSEQQHVARSHRCLCLSPFWASCDKPLACFTCSPTPSSCSPHLTLLSPHPTLLSPHHPPPTLLFPHLTLLSPHPLPSTRCGRRLPPPAGRLPGPTGGHRRQRPQIQRAAEAGEHQLPGRCPGAAGGEGRRAPGGGTGGCVCGGGEWRGGGQVLWCGGVG
jgi:hypothetical protein